MDERSSRAQIDERDAIRPIGAPAGKALDHRRFSLGAEANEAARMERLLFGVAPIDDLNRTIELHAGIERQHKTVGKERGVEGREGLAACGVGSIEKRRR